MVLYFLIMHYKNTGEIISEKIFVVDKQELLENDCDLTINKYIKVDNTKFENIEDSQIIFNRMINRNKEYEKILKKLEDII